MSAAQGKIIKVVTDFSKTPGARYESEGEFAGEVFRREVLEPALREAVENNQVLTVDLDGVAGYGTSFLEESFGGLVRINSFTVEQLEKHLKIKSEDEPYLIDDIREDIRDAGNEAN